MPPGIAGLAPMAAAGIKQPSIIIPKNSGINLGQLQGVLAPGQIIHTSSSGLPIPGDYVTTTGSSIPTTATIQIPPDQLQDPASKYAFTIHMPDENGSYNHDDKPIFAITKDGKLEVDESLEPTEIAMEVLKTIDDLLRHYYGDAFALLKGRDHD